MCLSIFDSRVNQFGIFGLLGGGQDQGRVGGGILRLVLRDSCVESVSDGQESITEE